VQFGGALLEAGEVQQVVEDAEQPLGIGPRCFEQFFLLRGQRTYGIRIEMTFSR
jgi:hypothetical protein